MILALKIAVISFCFSEILTSDGMIFSFMRKLPHPFTCPYCIAGQLALWSWLFPGTWIEILFLLSLPIVTIHVFLIVNERSQRDNKDSDGVNPAEKTAEGTAVPVKPENETTK